MSTLRGTVVLTRLALRLDRVRLPLWIVGIVSMVLFSAVNVRSLYTSPAQLQTYATLALGSPTALAVNGPGFGLDQPTLGAVITTETLLWAALGSALMSIFLVVRHTRAEEEAERTEMLRARMVGRHAPLASALLLVWAANVLVAVSLSTSLLLLGLPTAGSLAFGAAVLTTGLVFTGTGAVAAQLTSTDRSALGWGAGAVGVAYALRAVGDVGSGALSWVSPLGWAHRVRPFAGEQWWVPALALLTACALVALAVVLADRRDLGSGVLAARPGPDRAARWTRSPLGLTLRLQRPSILSWSVGLALLGVLYGGFGRDVEKMFQDNPDLTDYIAVVDGASLIDSYVSYTLLLGGLLASGFAIASVLRLHSEEVHGRAELVLSSSTGRTRWLVTHVLVALLGSVVLLVASGVGTGIGLALAIDEPGQVVRMTAASLVLLPAVMVMAGLAALLHGALPRAALATWGAYGAVIVIGLLAEVLGLPGWARDLSPFQHVPAVPAAALSLPPLLALAGVAAVLVALGAVAHRRRDIPAA